MTATQIISKFELYVGDTTELSTSDELDLLDKVYQQICAERPWEFTKKEKTGTMDTTTSITLPSDFSYLPENLSYTDISITSNNNAKPVVVLVNSSPFQVVNWSDRRQYQNTNNVCYLDIVNGKIMFPVAQAAGATYSFDYCFVPTKMGLSDSPIFPERFQSALYHGMAVDDMVIQLFDKARSYARENQLAYLNAVQQMAYWNANLIAN